MKVICILWLVSFFFFDIYNKIEKERLVDGKFVHTRESCLVAMMILEHH